MRRNKIFAWLILIVYVNAYTQWLSPIVKDWFEHAFFHHHHLEHVHHGDARSAHVSHEIAAMADQSDAEEPATQHLFEGIHPFFLGAHLAGAAPEPSDFFYSPTSTPNAPWRFHYSSVEGDVLFPPPKR